MNSPEGTPKLEEIMAKIAEICNYWHHSNTQRDEQIAAILRPFITPACSPPRQLKAMTEADQKTYDPIAELEYIAKEISGEDVALEDLSAQLEFAIQVLKEMKEYAATPASTGEANGALSDLLDDYRTQIVREMASQPCAPSEVRAEILARFAPTSVPQAEPKSPDSHLGAVRA